MSAYVATALPFTEAVPMIKGVAKLMSKAGFFGSKSQPSKIEKVMKRIEDYMGLAIFLKNICQNFKI